MRQHYSSLWCRLVHRWRYVFLGEHVLWWLTSRAVHCPTCKKTWSLCSHPAFSRKTHWLDITGIEREGLEMDHWPDGKIEDALDELTRIGAIL